MWSLREGVGSQLSYYILEVNKLLFSYSMRKMLWSMFRIRRKADGHFTTWLLYPLLWPLPMVEGMVFSSWLMWWASICQSTGGHQGTHVFLYAAAVVCISKGSLSSGMGFWHFKPDRPLERTGWSIHTEEETHVLCSLAVTDQAHQNLAVQFRPVSVFRSQWSDIYWWNRFLCTWLDELLCAASWCQINASFNI